MILRRQIRDIKVAFILFEIWWILFIEYFRSAVLRFLLNPFCFFDSFVSYHGLIRSKMILMISLHTIDPILSPLCLLGCDFDPFPFQRVLRLELPQMVGTSRFEQRIFANFRFFLKIVLGRFKIGLHLRDWYVFMWQSLEI